MPEPKTIIVTGANRGIGQAICRLFLDHLSLASNLRLIATSRKGRDLPFSSQDKTTQILYPKLDISSSSSISDFSKYIRDEIKTVHVLINNAGVNLETGQMQHIPDGIEGAEERWKLAKGTLDVNFRGTRELTLALMPYMEPYGDEPPRIVSLSSVGSLLHEYPEEIQSRFRDPNNSLKDLESIAEDFLTSVKSASEQKSGFSYPGRAYSVSKALVNAFTLITARDNPSILINCCCPGWIDTDMGGLAGSGHFKPPKSAEDGAKIPVKLAIGDVGGVSGRYWANDGIRSKESGTVQDW